METKANYVVVGAFVLILLVAGVIGLLWVARVQFSSELTRYDIFFTGSVIGLARGSAVNYNGIPAGRVVEMRIDPQNLQQVRVTVELDESTPIKSDAQASLETQGLTGVSYIEISGGSLDAPPLTVQPGQRYPVIASKPGGFQHLIASLPDVLNRVSELMTNLQGFLDDKNRAALAQTLANVQTLTAAAAAHAQDIESILGDAAATMHDLRRTVASAKETIDGIHDLVAERGEAAQTLKSFDDLARRLEQLTGHLDALVQENRAPLHDFLTRGLAEASALLVDARGLVASVSRVAGEIERDPTRFFFNSNRREGYQPR
jgi:phospholipid/cholesterol/gamma-HCH transport system substrate-binding protein